MRYDQHSFGNQFGLNDEFWKEFDFSLYEIKCLKLPEKIYGYVIDQRPKHDWFDEHSDRLGPLKTIEDLLKCNKMSILSIKHCGTTVMGEIHVRLELFVCKKHIELLTD